MRIQVGMYVTRKRDGATGRITARVLATSPFSRPGVYGTTVYDVRLDDEALRIAAGGTMTGDTGWLRSNFKIGSR